MAHPLEPARANAAEEPGTDGLAVEVSPEIHAHHQLDLTRRRIRELPPEVGVVLLSVGVAGLILPGPVGTPLILAGGLVLIPSVFGRLENWLHKRFPKSHNVGMQYVDRFIDDYEKRFPAADGPPQQ